MTWNLAPLCTFCGERKPRKTCSLCRQAVYCGTQCQRRHWYEGTKASESPSEVGTPHKKLCRRVFVPGRKGTARV
jgi:hypothetical protein